MQGAEPFARCGYCNADNLVTPDVLSRQIDHHVDDAGQYAVEVQKEAEQVASLAKRAQRFIIGGAIASAVLGWGISGCLAIGVSAVLNDREAPVNLEQQYAWMETDLGRCLADVRRLPDGTVRLDASTRGDRRLTRQEAAALQTLSANDIVGMRMVQRRRGFADLPGTVAHAYGSSGGDNDWELLRDDGDTKRIVHVYELCDPVSSP